MYEADLRSRFRNGLQSEAYERADMATDCPERDTGGWEVGRIQWAFETTFCDGNDAAESGTASK